MQIPIVKVVLQKTGYVEITGKYSHVYNIDNVREIFAKELGSNNVETVGLICLDTDNKIVNYSNISIGNIANVDGSIAQILKVALLSNSSKIMVAHNHPSGILNYTDDDIVMTKKIGMIARFLNIELLDSIVVVPDGNMLSIREKIREMHNE